MYSYGDRKVALIGFAQLGIAPIQLAMHNSTGSPPTISNINNAAELFNGRLKSLVEELNKNLEGAKFTFLNTIGISNSRSPNSLVKITETLGLFYIVVIVLIENMIVSNFSGPTIQGQ